MDVSQILSAIDAEITRLQGAREAVAALNGTNPVPQTAPRRGRPKGSKNVVDAPEAPTRKRKRNLSPEGRKRIQEAMQRRWAERRKGSKDSEK